ncbi:formate dehydrogenase subunit alpha [Shewanella sp. MTB7]|uniref:formate dehydrogenase subunit alpha n=6 Tax=unclassified Shewanella TaxID=196818 RepID=UPI0022BA49A9|nr:formate dehydrogenase subunit alpha [Shewanella sp. MTB7]WBJ94464.1 formate dehydrogenase subunit alpha [Shewanella sp. MTB7]
MKALIIDGLLLSANPEKTLFDIAKEADITIPNLCHQRNDADFSTNKNQKSHCNLCQVEVRISGIHPQGKAVTVRACDTQLNSLYSSDEQTIEVITQSAHLSLLRQTALTEILSDHFADCEAPCQQACPAGVDVQSYLFHIAQGNHREAIKVIKQTLPLPLSIGRVCPAFCEAECRRGLVDEPVAIRQLKRHAADLDLNDSESYVPPRAPATGKKVAIIGSGPAGISAGYFLSNAGHEVTIYEMMPKAGGWLRYGIPEYRLPKAILDKEIDLLCQNGLNIETNIRLGHEIHLSQLVEDFDAVCLAIGAQKAVPMNYPGSDLKGCYLGVDYLKDHCLDKTYTTGKRVAVIGGGNTAIDCARTAKREGADVTLIYRRTKEEMPAEDYEIVEAEHEGIKFHLLTNPIENHGDEHGRVKSVTFEKMALGEPDSSGRRAPVPTGETFTQAFDTVIPAVSQTPDMDFLNDPQGQLSTGKLALTRWNTFQGCDYTMSAGQSSGTDKLFVLGDSRTGPATAVAAVADGRKAAIAIEKLLNQGLTCELTKFEFNATKATKTASLSADLYPHTKVEAKAKMPELNLSQRLGSFSEVELGFANDEAMKEAARCLECACQANTDCKLRDYATEYKVDSKSLAPQSSAEAPRQFSVDNSSPFITFDANRCISCGACVDICHSKCGHSAISFESENHYQALPSSSLSSERRAPRVGFNTSMKDSDCVQCGSCVQVCPTGALVDARDKTQGVTDKLNQVSTVCTYCGIGCRLIMHVDTANNTIKHISGDSNSPVNDGMLCVKGRFGFDFIGSEQRLTQPLIRKNGELVEVSWNEAIDYIADKLSNIIATHGGDAVAGLASAKATNEDNYVFQKLFRSIIGTNNIDHCARLCHASTVTGLYDVLGSGAMTNDIPDIKESDLIFILGSDTSNAHPIIASKIKQAIRNHGARLVVADPKRVDISDHAKLYMCHKPGTDVMLLNAMMQQIIKHNWHDKAYLEARVDGFEALRSEVMKEKYSLANAQLITGVDGAEIATLAKMIGTAQKTAVYYAMGITQHTSGHDNVTAIANLQLLCGNIGVRGAGINPLRGQSNVQGACDMGALPNYFSGYQKVDDPAVQQHFKQAWGNETLPNKIGLAATEVMQALTKGKLKALYVMGENPVLSDPDQAHVVEALKEAELLIVQDIFLTETAAMAHVVLPALSFAEKLGHFTNTERRVQQLQVAVKAPGIAKHDWKIVQSIANALGANWDYTDEKQIWHEITQVTPQYGGISWETMDPNTKKGIAGLQWPCPEVGHPGTPILHMKTFTRGRAQMRAMDYRLPAEPPCGEYPLTLSTGRLLEQFHTGTLTRKTAGLDELGKPRVMISVYDAEKLGIANGDMLRINSRRGEIEIAAFVTKRAQVGVLFLPFHFAEAAANKLTINALDPVAKIPEFKICAIKVEKVKETNKLETE